MTSLEERWRRVLEGKAEAERRAGRTIGEVCLVAVSKFHPAEAIAELAHLGQRDFGENYMQEARAKQATLADIPIRWHAIGALQTNKAKDAAGRFFLVHTLASTELARALARRLPQDAVQDVLVEVNIGREVQKAGVMPEHVPAFLEDLLRENLVTDNGPGLRLRGLMCLPPHCGEAERARPYFATLRELRERMQNRFGMALPELSMGMSGDYAQAIEEGATIIRVGTDIFGPRPIRGQGV